MSQTDEIRFVPTTGAALLVDIQKNAEELFRLAAETDTQARLLRKCLELTAEAGKPLAAEWEARAKEELILRFGDGDRPCGVVLTLDQWKKLVHALRTIERHLK